MKNVKIYEGYKKKADFLLNFQLCRAYLGENCKKVTDAVEAILLYKFRGEIDTSSPDAYKAFTSKVRATGGKQHAAVELPLQDFKDSVENILAKFVENKFDRMVSAVKINLGAYPLKFRDIIEQYS
jgi:hypothetical protein